MNLGDAIRLPPPPEQERNDARTPHTAGAVGARAEEPGALRFVEDAVRGLEYGTVTIIVQDGVVVQVERMDRRRFVRGRSGK